MISLSKNESNRTQELWFNWGDFLTEIMDRQIKAYERDLSSGQTEWESARQLVDYTAKKRALIDLKNILSKQYG